MTKSKLAALVLLSSSILLASGIDCIPTITLDLLDGLNLPF